MLRLIAAAALSAAVSARRPIEPQRVTKVLASSSSVPSVLLHNAAVPGLTMPAIGLGTGAYSGNASIGYGNYPECWSSETGCGAYVQQAVKLWLSVGGRRIDSANSYQNQVDVGIAIAESGVPREEIFLLSKVGPSHPLGYNDSLVQFAGVLSDMNVTYVDMLLIHWPWDSKSQGNVTQNTSDMSTDPYCNHTNTATYNERQCRLNTWSALVQIFNSGQARAIGVSNYNTTHLQEIVDAGMPLPSLIQSPFHLYRSATQADVMSWADRHGVTFLGYSPFGVPDWKHYPSPLVANQLEHPTVVGIAANHSVTPAQVLLQWQWALGIPANPRSMSQQHMLDNLAAYSTFSLAQAEVDALSTVAQDMCSFDPSWYECAP